MLKGLTRFNGKGVENNGSCSMEIKYKNKDRVLILQQQAVEEAEYYKSFYRYDTLVKEERYFNNKLMGLIYYNNDRINHKAIISDNLSLGYNWIRIVEYQLFGDYKLEKAFGYGLNGALKGTDFALFDANLELIAHGYKDANGNYEYDRTRKYFWNRNINPDNELFECTYYEDTGELWELYWSNEHIDNTGQESFVLFNTPEDVQKLISLTGISQELAEYYMSSEIIPAW